MGQAGFWSHRRGEVDGGCFLAKVEGGITILDRASLCIWLRCQLSNDTYQLFMYLTLNQDLGRSLELVWQGCFLFSFLKIVCPTCQNVVWALFLVFRKTETQKHCGQHKIGNNQRVFGLACFELHNSKTLTQNSKSVGPTS